MLFERLQEMVTTMKASGLFSSLMIDGSFVTDKPAPNDIDLLAILRPGQNLERDLPMSDYALLSRAILRRRFGFDVVVAEPDSSLYRTYVDFFSRVREAPELRKGLLRLEL
jgi:hypothetical protein